ncbi:hypothetical protein B7G68_13170 [Caulobacter segnis]|uniref:Uncharacterized protein n=2 Tax=Caulobacter segnis TaxID=88688 RepID=D5VKK5_CAUST|nr:hypothetical protein [Caulobacter segnis]ADG11028.1 hypothetical protein Cseg_2574 [Caulobacter segnis ATCC 21756]AVQ02717.1 hypothetical protein B7G68_13170 [Caulobacter segnis]
MADDQETVAEAGWMGALRDVWRKAERLTVMTALGFLASTLVNSLIFDQWGQTFLAIATPTDVLMSGLRLAITPAMMGLAYACAYAGILSRRTWFGANFFFLSSVIVLGMVIAGPVGYGPAILRLWWAVTVVGWFTGALVALGAWTDRHANQDVVKSGLWRRLVSLFKRLWRKGQDGVLLAAYLIFCGVTVWLTSEAGYSSGQVRLHPTQTPPQCAGRVVWTGERAVVIDCGEFPAHDVQVLYAPQDLRIIRDCREWPNPAPPPMLLHFKAWLLEKPTFRQFYESSFPPRTAKAAPRKRPAACPRPDSATTPVTGAQAPRRNGG